MAVFVRDTFTEAASNVQLSSHTAEVGGPWVKIGGDASNYFEIANNGLRGVGGQDADYRATAAAPSADYRIVCNVDWLGGGGNVIQGFTGRMTSDGSDGYQVSYNGFNDSLTLFRVSGDEQLYAAPWPTADHVVELEMIGTTVVLKVNGSAVHTHTGAAITAPGYVGVQKYAGVTPNELVSLLDIEADTIGTTSPWIAAGAAATALSGNVTPAFPGSLQTNDILVCFITAKDNVNCSLSASGGTGSDTWTRHPNFPHTNGADLQQDLWYKRRRAGDTDTGVLVTHSGGGKISATIHQLRAADAPTTGNPFEASGGPTSVAAAATGTFPNATSVSGNTEMVYFLSYGEDFTTGPAISNAQGLTLTEREETEVA